MKFEYKSLIPTTSKNNLWAFFSFVIRPFDHFSDLYEEFSKEEYWADKYGFEDVVDIYISDSGSVIINTKFWEDEFASDDDISNYDPKEEDGRKYVEIELFDSFENEYNSLCRYEQKKILKLIDKKIEKKSKKKAGTYLSLVLKDAKKIYNDEKKFGKKDSIVHEHLKHIIQTIIDRYEHLIDNQFVAKLFPEEEIFEVFTPQKLKELKLISPSNPQLAPNFSPKINNPIKNKLDKTPIKGFGFTGSINILKELYSFELDEGVMINQNKTSLETFKTIFLESELSEISTDSKIHFSLSITKVSAFLYALQRTHLPNIKFTNIKKSRLFLTKQGTYLTDSNITKNKDEELIEEMVKEIENQIGKPRR